MKVKKKYLPTLLTSVILFTLGLGVLAWAAATELTLTSPADNSFDLDGNVTFVGSVKAGNVFDANGSLNLSFNTTNVSLWTNFSGWDRNLTNSTQPGLVDEGQGFFDVQFVQTDLNYSDGTHLLWAIEICTNHSQSNDATCNMSINYTLFVEYPPENITINAPSDNSNISANTFDVNISAGSSYNTGSDTLTCKVYTNDTSSNVLKLQHTAVVNHSGALQRSFNTSVGLMENESVVIAVQCFETPRPNVLAWATNITVDADRTNPVTALSLNFTNSVSDVNASKGSTVNLSYSVTEFNPQEFTLFINTSGNDFVQNMSRTGISNGDTLNFSLDLNDGDYVVGGFFWDFAGNNLTVTNRTFTIDTGVPFIDTIVNVSATNMLMTVNITWHTDEATNGSLVWGNSTTALGGDATSTSSFVNNHSVLLRLVDEGSSYYFNVTSCDVAGNCNSTNRPDAQFTIDPQTAIYAGWNAYGMAASSKSMGRIYNDSGADFVYWWNGSSQSWLSHTGGVGTNANHDILGGEVFWLFKSFNGSWARDVTVPSDKYDINLSSGSNFVAAQFDYTLDNLSRTFANATDIEISDGYLLGGAYNKSGTSGDQNLDMGEVEFYSFFNNSDQRYVSYFRNDTFNNVTIIGRGGAVYIGTPLNITWNGTVVFSNWSLHGV